MCIKNICRFFLRAQSQMNENMITYRKTKKGIRQKRAMEKEKITKDKLTKENKKETTALQAISADERKDWISLAFVQAGICVSVFAGCNVGRGYANLASHHFRLFGLFGGCHRYGYHRYDGL